jgi:hypothetical protein
MVGSQVGQTAWALARKFFDGSVLNSQITLSSRKLDASNAELRFNAVRGLYYKVHSASELAGPYSDGGAPGQVALEASTAVTNAVTGAKKFFRVSASLSP